MADAVVVTTGGEAAGLVALVRDAVGEDVGIKVLTVAGPQEVPLDCPRAEAAASVLSETVSSDPDVLLVVVEAGLVGDEIAARVAARTRAACALGVTSLTCAGRENPEWTWTRPVYGGALEASSRARGRIVVTADPVTADGAAIHVDAVPLDLVDARSAAVVLSRSEAAEDSRLEDARVVVSGGRGLGGPEGFGELSALADRLGGVLASSRPPCDAGWVPSTRQVGITGRKVSPDLYLAFGISGSVQHLAGMTGSRCIAAVNTDPEAAIFRHAHLGVVGDWREVAEALRGALDGGDQR